MATIKNVSGTAFVVAEFRASENLEAAPLYHDSVVELFLDEDSRDAARLVAGRFPGVRDLVRIRTKYLDDMLEKHFRAGFRQVVILGAGLDTRAVRMSGDRVTYFEIDDAATLELKRSRYEALGLDLNVRFIPGNYATDGLFGLLQRNGCDFAAPTCVIWEGNTMYLPRHAIEKVLVDLRRLFDRVRVSFDYMAEAVVAKTTGDRDITSLVESFADMGAPWVSGIPDVHELARRLRLGVIENYRTSDLYRSYWPGRPMTSRIFDFYSVCTLAAGI
jgi:methyltransferase (TIGR00027 family)